MKSKLPIFIPLLLVLAGGHLSAQTASLADRFQQLDRNGDGKLDVSEAGQLGFFKPADRNGDGSVTLEEAQAFAQNPSGNPDRKRTAGMDPATLNARESWSVGPR
jgi:hypothetical protein